MRTIARIGLVIVFGLIFSITDRLQYGTVQAEGPVDDRTA